MPGAAEKALADFQAEAPRAFAFLADDLGFQRTKDVSSHRDAVVEFERGGVTLGVGCELGSEPWVYLGLLDATGRRRMIGLHVVAQDALGSYSPPLSSASLRGQLEQLAEILRSSALDILSGRTERLPTLMKLQAEAVRERNRSMFGTSTGETPRFTGRPSLSALFGDTENPEISNARAYQAVWDYGYKPEEIATFLRTTAEGVEAMLRGWEDLAS